MVSITVVSGHKRISHGAHFVCPMKKVDTHLAVILCIDDMDLLHIDIAADTTTMEAHSATQGSIDS